MRHLFLAFPLLFIGLSLKAQKKAIVSGIVADSLKQKDFISHATISVYKSGDSSLITYSLSDDLGKFKITGLSIDEQYRIIISSWQFKTFRKELTLKSNMFDLGTIYLAPKENVLEEVSIKSEIPPVIVRNDTLEFNADSFKTLPTAVVEDLFKKLPGFVVRPDGKIEVNGKEVSRILVEGRDFFGGDQLIATKNLPANIINKVQVVDDKVIKRRNPDLSPSNIPLVINLSLKKAVKKGIFGKVYAGTGFNERFETGGILNTFRDTTQVSILAYGNNINRTSFEIDDITHIGGFDRSGYSNTIMGDNGSVTLDGISFGGGGSGIQYSSGAGANFNTLTKKNLKINGKYFYGRNNSFLTELINDDQTLAEGHLINNSSSASRTIFDTHNLGLKFEWEPTPLSSFTITPSVKITPSSAADLTNAQTYIPGNTPLSAAVTKSDRAGRNTSYTINTDYWRDFKKEGRSLSMTFIAENDKNSSSNYNYSSIIDNTTDASTVIDQYRNNKNNGSDIYLSVTYIEPLSKKIFLSTIASSRYVNKENVLLTFYKDPLNDQYGIIVPNFSETVNQDGFRTNLRTTLKWVAKEKLIIRSGVYLGNLTLKNRFTSISGIKQNYNFIFPTFSISYKNFNADYTSSFQEPDIQYLQPVKNNTDPLYIQEGNVNLLPSKTQRFFARIWKNDQKRAYNFNITSNNQIKTNGIIYATTIDNKGVQIRRPINVNNQWDLSLRIGAGKYWKNVKRQFNLSFALTANYNKNYVDVNNIRSKVNTSSLKPYVGLTYNLLDKIELAETYTWSANRSIYQDSYFSDQNYLIQTSESTITLRYLKKVVFDSRFSVLSTNQKLEGYKNTLNMWNAGATFLFLKDDRGQVRFSVNDLLKSNVGRTTLITANSIRDVQSNTLGRYFLLTLSYNIRSFGDKK